MAALLSKYELHLMFHFKPYVHVHARSHASKLYNVHEVRLSTGLELCKSIKNLA